MSLSRVFDLLTVHFRLRGIGRRVKIAGGRPAGRDGRGELRRRRQRVRVHGLRADRVDLEGWDGLGDRAGAPRRRRRRLHHPGPGPLGRAHGRRPRLLRARQRGHLQRPGALPVVPAVRDEPDLRRLRRAPRLVLQVRRGHRRGDAPGLRQGRVRRRAVARHGRAALPALRRARRLRQERRGGGVMLVYVASRGRMPMQ
jgi:hypothetical protein